MKDHPSRSPKVSVIIPVYNVETFLRPCLDSVVNQGLKEIEILCVNDCTTDNSQEILDEYAANDKRFTLLKHDINKGLGEARNTGIDHARGTYIIFIDSDDLFYDETSIEHLYHIAQNNDNDIVIGSTSSFDYGGDGSSSLRPMYTNIMHKDAFNISLEDYPPLININSVWNRLFRTGFLRKYNIRHEPPRFAEDIPFSTYTYFHSKSLSITKRPTLKYRRGRYFEAATPQKCIDSRINFIRQFKFIATNGSLALQECMQKRILDALWIAPKREIMAKMGVEDRIKELHHWQEVLTSIPQEIKLGFKKKQIEYFERIESGQFDGADHMHDESGDVQERPAPVEKIKPSITMEGNPLKDLELHFRTLKNSNRQLATQLDELLDSTSWRVTSPLRWMMRRFRRIW